MFVTRALAIVAVVFCSFVSGAAMAFDKMAFDQMAFDIEAHRGGRALFPENTLVSFANALTMGVTTLELDIGVTKDGAIVVSHERGLNPDLAGSADGVYVAPPGTPFVQLSLAEVKTYDVGHQARQRLCDAVSRSARRAWNADSNAERSAGAGAEIRRQPCAAQYRNQDRSQSPRTVA